MSNCSFLELKSKMDSLFVGLYTTVCVAAMMSRTALAATEGPNVEGRGQGFCCFNLSMPVLSVNHKFGTKVKGKYFNFLRHRVPSLTPGGTMMINGYNSRTRQCGEVILWGSSNGGSKGDGHGRFNSKPLKPTPGQWRTGDRLVINHDNCQSAPHRTFSVKVLGTGHRDHGWGKYFNFMRLSIPGLQFGEEMRFNAKNSRTGEYGQVVVWGNSNGGLVGNAHGRFDYNPVAPRTGQWRRGDYLVVMM